MVCIMDATEDQMRKRLEDGTLEKYLQKIHIKVDKNGKKRELHIDNALEVAKLTTSAESRRPLRVLKYRCGCTSEMLCHCKHFVEVYRMIVNTERCKNLVMYQTDSISFQVLLCTDRCGTFYFWE